MAFPEIPLPELLRDLPEEQQELVAGGVSNNTSSSADSDEITGSEGYHAERKGDTWNFKDTSHTNNTEGDPISTNLFENLFSGFIVIGSQGLL